MMLEMLMITGMKWIKNLKYNIGTMSASSSSSSSGHKISAPKTSNENKAVVFTYGRFQPPHIGHELLITKLVDFAKTNHATPYVIVSGSCNEKWFLSKTYKSQRTQLPSSFESCNKNENPLPLKRKLFYLRKMFPLVKFVAADKYGKNIFSVIGHLKDAGYTKFTGFFGSDRAPTFERMFNKAEESLRKKNETLATPTISEPIHIDIESVGGLRNDESDDIQGASATKMREAAVRNTPQSQEYFRKHSKIGNMTPDDIDNMMREIRDALWEPESTPSSPPSPCPSRRSSRKQPITTNQKAGQTAQVYISPIVNHTPRPAKYKLRKDERPPSNLLNSFI